MFNLFKKINKCNHEYVFLEETGNFINNKPYTYHFICKNCDKQITVQGQEIQNYGLKLLEKYTKYFNQYNCSFPDKNISDEKDIFILGKKYDSIILDVYQGAYGNGEIRNKLLKSCGYNPQKIQEDLNKLSMSLKESNNLLDLTMNKIMSERKKDYYFRCKGWYISDYICRESYILYDLYYHFKYKYNINIFNIPNNINYDIFKLKEESVYYSIYKLQGPDDSKYRLYMIYSKLHSVFETEFIYYFINYNGDIINISSYEIEDIKYKLDKERKIKKIKNINYNDKDYDYKEYFKKEYGFDIISDIENRNSKLIYYKDHKGE